MIKLYAGEVTAGGIDGTAVSENMSQTNPLSISLDGKSAEAKAVRLALRCDSGYQTVDNVTVSAYRYDGENYVSTGGNIDKFRFAADEDFSSDADALANANWQTSLTIADVIGTTNHVFWAKVMSETTQSTQKDTTVSIHVAGAVERM